MAIRAKIDIYDDETGIEYVRNKVLEPTIVDDDPCELSVGYVWMLKLRIARDVLPEYKENTNDKDN